MSKIKSVIRKNGSSNSRVEQVFGPSFENLEGRLLMDAAPVVTVTPLATNNLSPVLTGTVDDPAAVVHVTVDSNTYDAINDGVGGWHTDPIDPLPSVDALYDVAATATDGALVGTDATTNELQIDLTPPDSSVTSVSPFQDLHQIDLTWAGQDNAGGSGIASYDIYVTINGGAPQLALANQTGTSGIYQGQPGDTYSFYSLATDVAGNVQQTFDQPTSDVALWSTTDTVLSAQTHRTVTFTDVNGTAVKVTYSGKGAATITQTINPDSGFGDITNVQVDGSTTSSGLTIKPASPGTVVGNITVNGSISYIKGSLVDMDGSISVIGTAKSITLRDMLAPATVDIAGTGKGSVAMKFNIADDLTVNSGIRISSLSASEWLNTDGLADSITAPSLGTLKIAGSTGVNLTLGQGMPRTATALGTAVIGGDWAASTMDIIGKIGTIKVAGWLSGDQITSTNNISTIKVGGLQDTNIYAGMNDGTSGLPAAADFNPLTPSTIKSLTVTNAVQDDNGFSMIDSNIAAAKITSARLGRVQFDNSGVAFGVATEKLTALRYMILNATVKWTPAIGNTQDFNVVIA